MSVNVERPTLAQYTARKVRILEHRIPSVGSAPYICVEGPDRNLWFCESGPATKTMAPSKILRFTQPSVLLFLLLRD